MFMAVMFGLTPFSPVGLIGIALTMKRSAHRRPTRPKRIAGLFGGSLAIVCLELRLGGFDTIWLISGVGMCVVLTWLEAVLGFCVGCRMHGLFFGCKVCNLE